MEPEVDRKWKEVEIIGGEKKGCKGEGRGEG